MQKLYYIKLHILTAKVGNGERKPSLLVTKLREEKKTTYALGQN